MKHSVKDPIRNLIDGFIYRDNHQINTSNHDAIFWNADFFLLGNVTLYQDHADEQKQVFLKQSNDMILSESMMIEELGIEYSAKLALQSDSSDEKQLYALMGADEATHLYWLSSFGSPPDKNATINQPFNSLLREIIDHADRQPMIYLLQIILEGWGLQHYRHLQQTCCSPQLAAVLKDILKDESLHHATGMELFNNAELSAMHFQYIVDVLNHLLTMVRVGPQRTLSQLDNMFGGLNKNEIITILNEMNFHPIEQAKANYIKSLILKSKLGSLIKELDDRNCFQIYSAEQCAAAYLANR